MSCVSHDRCAPHPKEPGTVFVSVSTFASGADAAQLSRACADFDYIITYGARDHNTMLVGDFFCCG